MVQVNVELETMRETILERRIDPDSRVAIATETDERTNTARDTASGGVTVASNLPDGDAGPGGSSSSEGSETRERVTFDMSELQREVAREPGDIRRVSVAVLLNGVRSIGADGIATVDPRPEAEIAALQALVQSAIGYTAERDDSVTIQSMAFEETVQGDLVQPGFADRMSLDLGRVVQTLVLAAAALFIAFGLLRPMLRREPGAALSDPTAFATALPGVAPGYDRAMAAPILATGPAPLPSLAAPVGAAPQAMARPDPAAEGFPALPAAFPAARGDDLVESLPDPVDRLRRLIEEREEETIEILRSWMEEDERARP